MKKGKRERKKKKKGREEGRRKKGGRECVFTPGS